MTIFLFLIFVVVFAALMSKGGGWDNLLTWVNMIVAGLFAMNYFEPLADYLSGVMKDFHWYWDFLAFWAVFSVAMILLKAFTDGLSKIRVKFRVPVEWGVRGVFSLLCAWTMICVVTFSLHLAPVQMVAWNEGFMTKPDDTHFMGADRDWMSFAHKMSNPDAGSLSKDEQHVFDQDGVFRVKYALRRYRHELLPQGATKGPMPLP
ncbi:MAG: hypothetical protein QM811_25885 [Pirellulales bacterium]